MKKSLLSTAIALSLGLGSAAWASDDNQTAGDNATQANDGSLSVGISDILNDDVSSGRGGASANDGSLAASDFLNGNQLDASNRTDNSTHISDSFKVKDSFNAEATVALSDLDATITDVQVPIVAVPINAYASTNEIKHSFNSWDGISQNQQMGGYNNIGQQAVTFTVD